jgi:hypothetical protein
VRRARDLGDQLGRELQPRQNLHALRHRGEALLRGRPTFGRRLALAELDLRHREHEARIDAVVTGGEAASGARAGFRPPGAGARGITVTPQDREDVAHHAAGIADVDTGRSGGRTHLDAPTARRAVIENVVDPGA